MEYIIMMLHDCHDFRRHAANSNVRFQLVLLLARAMSPEAIVDERRHNMVVALEPGAGYPPQQRVTTTSANATSAASAGAKGSAGKPASGSGSDGSAPAATPSIAAWKGAVAKAASTAEGFDKTYDISALDDLPYGALAAGQWDLLAQSAKNWDAVRQTTYDALINNNSGAYPDLAASKEVAELDASEPGNKQFAAANKAALGEADQQWSDEGITYAELHPVIAAYNNVLQTTKAVSQYLDNPHLPHNRAIVSTLLGSEQDAEAQLTAAIEASLTDAANQAGSDPKARSQAITARAAYIEMAGPQDTAFRSAVDNANYDLQVVKPAQSVADAYAKGGALAAANQLAAVTTASGNSYYASQIISQSQGTINLIAQGLGDLAAGKAQQPGQYAPSPSVASTQFYQIYGDLSQAVGAANPYGREAATSGKLTSYGKQAAQIVGDAIAAHAPTDPAAFNGGYDSQYESGLYGAAVNLTFPNDDGALSLATAVALGQRGDSNLASSIMDGLSGAFNNLNSQTSHDFQAFGTTMANLNAMRAIWGPFMSSSQLVKATNGYLAANPGVRTQADAELAALGQDGTSIATAMTAWNTFRGQLNGVAGFGDLSKSVGALTGSNAATAFAVSQSNAVSDAIAGAITGLPGQAPGSGSTLQGFLASPAWRVARGARRFENNLLKILDGKNYTVLYAIGFVTNVLNAVAHGGYPVSSPLNVATSAYNFIGLKFAGETLAGLAKSRIASTLASDLGISTDQLSTMAGKAAGRGLSAAELSKVASAEGIDIPPNLVKLAGLPDLAWFKGVNVAFFGSDAIADLLLGEQSFDDGDPVDGALNVAAGVGSAINSLKATDAITSLFGSADMAGTVGAGITLASVIGIGTHDLIEDVKATHAYQAGTAEFLEAGLGLSPGVAAALSAPAGGSSLPAVAAELAAFANAKGIAPGQLLLDLNRQPVADVAQFLNVVSNVATGKLVGPRGGVENLTPEQGFQLLNYDANGIFGPNPVR
jgi:hypothetical protein